MPHANYPHVADVYREAMKPAMSACAMLLIVSGSGHLGAQAQGPTFDVVSVKPNTQGAGGPTMINVQPGGRFVATNIPLANLIMQAYRLQSFQLIGAPSWVSSERFDIEGKASGELSPRPDPNPNAPPGPLQLMTTVPPSASVA